MVVTSAEPDNLHPTIDESLYYTSIWPQHAVFSFDLTQTELNRSYESNPNGPNNVLYVATMSGSGSGTIKYNIIDAISAVYLEGGWADGDQLHPIADPSSLILADLNRVTARSADFAPDPQYTSLGFARRFVPPLENPFDSNDSPVSSFETYLDAADGAASLATTAWNAAYLLESGSNWDGSESAQSKVAEVCGGTCPPLSRLSVSSTVGAEGLYAAPAAMGTVITPTTCQTSFQEAISTPGTTYAGNAAQLQQFFECVGQTLATTVGSQSLDAWSPIVRDVLAAGGSHAVIDSEAGGALLDTLIKMNDAALQLQADGTRLVVLVQGSSLIVADINNIPVTCQQAQSSWWSELKTIGTAAIAIYTAYQTGGLTALAGGAAGVISAASALGTQSNSTCDPAQIAQKVLQLAEEWKGFATDYVNVLTSTQQDINSIIDAETELKGEIAVLTGSSQSLAAATPQQLGPSTWRTALSPTSDSAHDALTRSQASSFLARRAMEARLAVDLSSSVGDMITLPAPAGWVDNVFAGSRSVVQGETPLTYTPSYMTTYDDTLRQYLSAYAVAYPFSVGNGDHVVSLASVFGLPASGHLVEQFSAKCAQGGHKGPKAGACVNSGGTLTDNRCGTGGVDAYVVELSLDATAQNAWPVVGIGTQPPNEVELANNDEFNFRVLESAINLVGTGVAPTDANTGFGSVGYKLEHGGQTLVADAQFSLRQIVLPYGLIASGEARTGGGKLTTPLVGDELSSMTSYLEEELKGRPPGGIYTLTLSTTGATLCNVKDVEFYLQLLSPPVFLT